MPRLRPAVVLAALCLTFACAATGRAPTVVLPDGVMVDFPTAITFTLPDPPQDVAGAAVVYKVEHHSCAEVSGYAPADMANGPRWTWDLSDAGGLPPGARITYRWETRDAAGVVSSTPERAFTVEDARYQWREVREGLVTVRWHSGSESFARQMLGYATESVDTLTRETGTPLQGPATIHIYQSTSQLRGALINAQEWTGGQAFPQFGLIAIAVPSGSGSLGKPYIAHELSHLFIGQATFSCYTRAPSWLDEGLATRAEGPLRPEFQSLLGSAIARDDLFTVRALRAAFPTAPAEASLAYAQSASLVDYLLEHFGADRMAIFLEALREGLTDDAALHRAYGFDQEGLYARWRAWKGLAAPAQPVPTPTSTPVRIPTPPGLNMILSGPAGATSQRVSAFTGSTAIAIATGGGAHD